MEAIKNLDTLKLVEEGDFVISLRSFQGGIEYSYCRGIISPAYTVLKAHHLTESYFKHLAKSPIFIDLLKSTVTGIREGQNIDYNKLRVEFLPIPPIEEQQAIASYLDTATAKIDEAIAQQQKMIDLLNERKQIIINNAVTKGLNPNAKMKDSGVEYIGMIPEGWSVRRMASLGYFSKGGGISRDNLQEEGEPAILYGDIYTKYNYFAKDIENHIPQKVALESIEVHKNELLMTGSGETKEDIGKTVVFLGDKAYAGGDVIIFKQNENNSTFLSYVLNSSYAKDFRYKESKGEIVVHIYANAVRRLFVALPDITEQGDIVEYLNDKVGIIDSEISVIRKRMWLAELLKKLPSGGIYTPETYWNRWAQGDNYKLPYDIVLHGRESISHELIETCKSKKSIFLQALTQDECIAFAIATLRTKEIDSIYDRTIIVTKKEAYEDLVEHYDNLILITTLTEGIHYSTRKGHTIVVASTPADQVKNTIILPIIEKQGFIDSLVNMGIDEAKAWNLAKDTTRDINVLRRRIEIIDSKPQWADTIIDLLPAILVGEWHSNCEGDKQILEKLVGSQYEQFEQKLHSFLLKEGAPLLHISDIWRIISPYESIEYILHSNCFTTSILEKFQSICIELIQDDDTEAVGKSKEDGFCFHKNNQKYSSTIKKGVCQTLCLLSVLSESDSGNISQWVEETIRKMLEGWTLTRFLSAQSLLPLLCEVSPSIYLKFVENLPIEMIDEIFKPVKKNYSISNWGINYTELLWSLEMLAWDESFLKRVTQLLLKYSKYENKSNYVNRPENSLDHIYRYYLPQTYVSFENRIAILKSLSSQYRNEVFSLCTSIIKSVEAQVLEPSSHFKWRLFGRLESPKNLYYIALPELKEVVKHMLQCCDYSSGEIVELIKLSFNANMLDVRDMILEAINEHLADVNDNQIIADTLREEITHHKQCEGAKWALPEQELAPYQNLLDEILPKDVLKKNLWLFEDYYAQLPHKRQSDISKAYEEQENVRCQALQSLIRDKGLHGLWDFIQMVKCPESMANSIITIFEDKLNDDICRKYKSKELNNNFTISYLKTLYRKDSQKYIKWAEQKMHEDNDMVIALFAPGYVKELADIAENHGDLVKQIYWSKILVEFWNRDDSERIVRELISVNRYGSAIGIIESNVKEIQIPDEEIVGILYNYFFKGYFNKERCDMYQITSILEVLDKSDNPTVIQTLILIEFLLYRYLEHSVDLSTLRLTKELSKNPELMIQLVELAYRPDDGIDEQCEGDAWENKKIKTECAIHILRWGKNIVSFSNEEGIFDGNKMKQYIFELYRLAKERNRTKVGGFYKFIF